MLLTESVCVGIHTLSMCTVSDGPTYLGGKANNMGSSLDHRICHGIGCAPFTLSTALALSAHILECHLVLESVLVRVGPHK